MESLVNFKLADFFSQFSNMKKKIPSGSEPITYSHGAIGLSELEMVK